MANQLKKLFIDNRTPEDIIEDIRSKAKSYIPEWQPDDEDPDIGYAISRVFARQMGENIDRLNQVIDNYHVEFINMLDISPGGARPAEGLVEFDMSIDTIPGTYIPKGTKLMGDTPDTSVIYETQNSLYATSSALTSIFMVDGEEGYVVPLKGLFKRPSIVPDTAVDEEEEPIDTVDEEEPTPLALRPFRLFGEDETIAENAMYFFNESVVDTGTNPVFARVEGNEKLIEKIQDGRVVFKWLTKEGLVEFKETSLNEDGATFTLVRDGVSEEETISVSGRPYHIIVLESKVPVLENEVVDSVTFSSMGNARPLDFATDGIVDFNTESFLPFGEELSPYSQCFIGMESYFSKNDANICMEFEVSYGEHNYQLGGLTPDGSSDLRVIKKKPRVRPSDIPVDCVINEISLEYFNGTGWKKLDTKVPQEGIFEQKNNGTYTIEFKVPGDWAVTDAGAHSGRMLKMQIIRADNCYYRPCIHYYPQIKDARVTYSYEEKYLPPSQARAISGTRIMDYTKYVYEGRKFNLFSSTQYYNDALYLGFSRAFENGPISIMFDIEERFGGNELKYVFEYSCGKGFRQMKVMDSTCGMTRSGVVTFLPQPDMTKSTLEGKHLYWIRITRNKFVEAENRGILPLIRDIRLNVVRVANINVMDWREIYIDEVVSNQTVELHEDDILDVELWVNEFDSINQYELEKLKQQKPEDVDISYDGVGNMTSCFVRFRECNSFQFATDKRVYILDRLNGVIRFGDGIRTSTLQVLDDVAARLRIRKCQGSRGNAAPDTINQAVGNLLYIDTITNPLKIYNGSDMESVEEVLKRGSLLLQARNRLLSADDFRREILLFSDAVSDMEIICEKKKDGGENPLAVSCVLLLKEYDIGQGAFYQVAEGIKNHLLENCELTITEDNLHVVDPIFVDISVDIWAESMNMDESFDLQNIIKEDLEDYLSPTNGWKIGTLPKPSQILMRLNVLKSKAIIRKSVIIAKYTDHLGDHEIDIKNVEVSPFMICRSGEHNVHIILSE